MLATARFYHQFAAGRLYLNEETDTLHPTWRGALAIATAELFPLNLLRKLASQRYAAHILQSAALPLPRPLPAQVI